MTHFLTICISKPVNSPTIVLTLFKLVFSAIYGLRQASRACYDELKAFLLSNNFKPTISDPSLFANRTSPSPLYVLVYVDDIIITGPDTTLVSSFTTSLSNRFSLKDLGTLSYFLGVEVLPHHDGLFLSQAKYILDVLTKASMTDCKPASTPMSPSATLSNTVGTPISNPTSYRSLIGALQYLSLTRPDVTFAVDVNVSRRSGNEGKRASESRAGEPSEEIKEIRPRRYACRGRLAPGDAPGIIGRQLPLQSARIA
ncbi:hypothetical protein E3N88_37607 [Mikania micrantha]|uniref:Reverse transcriptase Ty1/copia-type domain-containing protein n=1 Tax=Mikania micrantha TaxID=192012 RepID=A0A5N6LRT9_9ASTR|nr:hypothetical protein E3N88_37607 [Mikania micrantha]